MAPPWTKLLRHCKAKLVFALDLAHSASPVLGSHCKCSSCQCATAAHAASVPVSPFMALCRRKQRQLQVQLQEVGDDALGERLQGAAERPADPPFRLSTLIQVRS